MRRFEDRHGWIWDVTVGRESFGALYALFIPVAANPGEPRQALLEAVSQMDAEVELDGMTGDELKDLLRRSEPKGMA
jgi:hypothetical protein